MPVALSEVLAGGLAFTIAMSWHDVSRQFMEGGSVRSALMVAIMCTLVICLVVWLAERYVVGHPGTGAVLTPTAGNRIVRFTAMRSSRAPWPTARRTPSILPSSMQPDPNYRLS